MKRIDSLTGLEVGFEVSYILVDQERILGVIGTYPNLTEAIVEGEDYAIKFNTKLEIYASTWMKNLYLDKFDRVIGNQMAACVPWNYFTKRAKSSQYRDTDPESVPRDPTWRQPTPRLQLITLISAAQGNLFNAQGGIGDLKRQLNLMADFLRSCQTILRSMPEGQWSDSKKE